MHRFKLILLSILFVATTSCDDYLDVVPDNIATIDNAFSNEFEAYKFLTTCYSYMPNYGSTTNNPAFYCGDEAWLPEASLNEQMVKAWYVARGSQRVTDPYLNYWGGDEGGTDLYGAIRDCNIFIEKVNKVLGLEVEKRDRWIAETKVLKAYYHFWLLRMYGPIILIKENLPVDTDSGELFKERSSVDECFEYIISLIDEAESDLPLTIDNRVEELGRLSKPAALALKARILLEAASPLFNGNSDFASLKNLDGKQLFNSNPDPNKWQLAKDACDSAIVVAELANHALFDMDDYISPYVINDTLRRNSALRSAVTERYNKEIIWGCSKSWSADMQNRSFARLESGYYNQVCRSNLAPTMRIAEQFYTDNGVPIDEDTSWDFANRYEIQQSDEDTRYFVNKGSSTVKFHYNREPRFYSTLGFDRGVWYGSGKYNENDLHYVKAKFGEPANQYNSIDYSITGYWAKKLVNIQTIVNSSKNGLSEKRYAFPIIRMSDLYLMYAEAANEVADAPTQDIYDAVNKVRERAGLPTVENSWTNFSRNPTKYTTKDGMRDIIHGERLIEFAMEAKRYWDIRRWKKAVEYFNRPIIGWDLLQKDTKAFYQKKVLYMQEFKVRDYFWPIKEYQLTINPKLVQNIGW